ncbi:hypothetical protein [Caulobacter sp. S45]|uniref:hypothetical protein n=1 Tax=Caulobacter sp. S45 TaxID=1641861 RepID=UPI00131C2D85|nr:hypothetical protein [Caulobacter sp. S45]
MASWPAVFSTASPGRTHGRTDHLCTKLNETLANGEPSTQGAKLPWRLEFRLTWWRAMKKVGRAVTFHLSPAGLSKTEEGLSLWEAVQREFEASAGEVAVILFRNVMSFAAPQAEIHSHRLSSTA